MKGAGFVVVLFLLFQEILYVIGDKIFPCEYYMSLNITNGLKYDNGSVFAENHLFPPDSVYEYLEKNNETSLRGCICHLKPCFRKCCPDGTIYNNASCDVSEEPEVNPFNPPVYSGQSNTSIKAKEYFKYLSGMKCTFHYQMDEEDVFYLQKDGTLMVLNADPDLPATYHSILDYCLDYFSIENDTVFTGNICFDPEEAAQQDKQANILLALNAIGMTISIPLLIATLLVYAIVPELRNLHGKALMGYVSALLGAFSCLMATQIYTKSNNIADDDDKTGCIVLAFCIYFLFLVTFFWLNVMSIDIWWTFRGMRAASGRRAAEKRRFILYGLYAWGVPLLMTGFCIFMHFGELPGNIVKPNVGKDACWIYGKTATLLYFYLPLIILSLINIILFSITAYRIIKIKKETAVLSKGESKRHSHYEKDKQRFMLYIKLFLVMGLTWSAESTSFIIGGPDYYWALTDFINSLQGILIFIIFVCKPKIKNLLIKRYRLMRYGSTVARTRDSSRYRSHTTNSSIMENTERSFLSDDNTVRLSKVNYK